MNLEEELIREQSKAQALLIAAWIGNRQPRFDQLISFITGNQTTLARRAAWVLCHCVENHPALIDPHLKSLVELLQNPDCHHAVRRSITKSLEIVELPDDLLGLIYDTCSTLLNDPNEPAASRVYSMSTMCRICKRHPELAPELELMVKEAMPHGSPAMKARGRTVLSALAKL